MLWVYAALIHLESVPSSFAFWKCLCKVAISSLNVWSDWLMNSLRSEHFDYEFNFLIYMFMFTYIFTICHIYLYICICLHICYKCLKRYIYLNILFLLYSGKLCFLKNAKFIGIVLTIIFLYYILSLFEISSDITSFNPQIYNLCFFSFIWIIL